MEKGQTNNPNGRPKGKPNKSTRELRDVIQCIIEKNLPQMARDLKALSPKDRLDILVKLMAYVAPKMQTVEAEMKIEQRERQLTPKEAAELIKKLQDEV